MNKFKTTLTLSLIAILGLSKMSFAQESCNDKYIIFNSALSERNYPLAYTYWTQLVAGDCQEIVKEKKTVYTNGAYVLGKLLKEAGASKQAKTDSLLWSHEQHIAMFGEESKTLEKFGKDLYVYKLKTDPAKVHEVLGKAINNGANKVSYPETYQYYFHTVLIDYQKTKDASKVVTEYLMLKENGVKFQAGASEKLKARWKKVLAWIDAKGQVFLTCDKLVEIYEGKFESIKTNKVELQKAADLLDKKKCEGEIVVKINTEIIKLIPDAEKTAKDWFTMSKLNVDTDKSAAQEYLDKALSMEKVKEEKSKMFEYGVNHVSESKYVSKWESEIPSDGRPNLIKARKIANSVTKAEVGESIALRSLVYSLAMDYCDKAASDSKVSSEAKRLKASYEGRLPSCTEMFREGKEKGSSYTVPYWKEKTTVRCR